MPNELGRKFLLHGIDREYILIGAISISAA
jgi:hypothetical protein